MRAKKLAVLRCGDDRRSAAGAGRSCRSGQDQAFYIVPVSNWATILLRQARDVRSISARLTASRPVHFQSTLRTSCKDGVPGYYSNEYIVRNDSGIKKVEDLKGKVLATNGYGSGTDIPLRIMLAKHGINDKKDVNIIEAPIPETMGAMLNAEEGRSHPLGPALYRRSEGASERACAVHRRRRDRHQPARHVGNEERVHCQKPRRADRFHGRRVARRALVFRSRQPCRGGERSRSTPPRSRRRSGIAGSSRKTARAATSTAIPTASPTWRRCRRRSTSR